jgi:anti-anti-sigma factor
MADRKAVHVACIAGDHHDVIVDLSKLTFMDSQGYRALTSAKELLRRRGTTMSLVNPCGQPERLIDLLSRLEVQTRP